MAKPAGGVVICKKLQNRGLHTFHDMLGYCMKDVMKDHFEIVNHNISMEDMNIGMEQYMLYGQEENKNCVVLTHKNFAKKVFNWRKRNCHHPVVVDFLDDLFCMPRTRKYYPSSTWVVGGYGRGFNPART